MTEITIIAPSCPVSFGQFETGRVWAKGDPRARAGNLQDLIHSIPQAHDLPSVIRALNVMSHVITQIMRSGPAVNNVYPTGEPSVILKGEDFNPHYQDRDWIEEGRQYKQQYIVNPDDQNQYIEIKTLSMVSFFNENTSYRLNYYGP